MNAAEKKLQRQENFQNGKLGCYSLKAIIPLLIFLFPIGLILLIKRIIITKDFPMLRRNAIIALVIVIVAGIGIENLSSNDTATDKTASASEKTSQETQDTVKTDTEQASGLTDKEFQKKIIPPIPQDDIVKLYNSDLTEDQRKQLIEAVDNDRKSGYLEDIEDHNGNVERSIDDMVSSLAFLDEIQSDDWNDLRSILKSAKDYQAADEAISKIIDEYPDAEIVNTDNVLNLDAYVLYKATNSKCFIITDYTESNGSVHPDYNWYAAVKLKKTPSGRGVINVTATTDGTFHYKTDDGFEGDIQQYKEVSATDIEYSKKYHAQYDAKQKAISDIKRVLGIE